MVTTCAVFGCSNKYRNKKKISFHVFPKNPLILRKWLLSIRRENSIPGNQSRICSEHFRPEDFVINFGKKTLKHDAIPSIFNFSKHLISKPTSFTSAIQDMTSTRDVKWSMDNRQVTALKSDNVCEVMNTSLDIIDMLKVECSVDNIQETTTPNVSVCEVMNTSRDIVDMIKVESSVDDIEETVSASDYFYDVTNASQDIKDIIKVECSVDNIQETATQNVSVCEVMNTSRDIVDMIKVESSVDDIQETVSSSDYFYDVTNASHDLTDIEEDECSLDDFQGKAWDNANISIQSSEPKKRRRSVPAYVGDIEPSDLEKPEKFKRMWEIATKTITKHKKNIKYLQTKLRRSLKKIETLTDLVTSLKNENKSTKK